MANEVIDDKYLMIDAIKSEYPGINEQGIAAIMANVQLESGGGRSGRERPYTLEQIYRKHTKKSAAKWNKLNPDKTPTSAGKYVQNITTIRKNVKALGFGDPKNLSKQKIKEWNDKLKQNPDSIIGAMYMQDFSATWAGGSGPLQLTISNYGGNKKKAIALKQFAKDQGMEFDDYMEKFSSDPAFGLQQTLKYYKSTGDKAWTTESLNATDAKTLGDTVINPHRKHLNDEKWQVYQTAGNDSVVDYNTNYLPTIIEATPSGTELTQEEKDQIAIDTQPTPGTTTEKGQFGDIVLSQIEVDKENARRKQEEEKKKKEEVYQKKELVPLSDLTEEEINNLTDEERKEYGLQPTVNVVGDVDISEELTPEQTTQIEKERLLGEEEKLKENKYSQEQLQKQKDEEEKKRKQKKAEDKVVDKDGDGIPDTIDADGGEPAPENQLTVSTEEQVVINEQEKEEAIETVETEEMEVLDANGNIKKITVPTVKTPTTVETESVETEEVTTPEKIVEKKPELVKPKLKDFKTSGDYMKARMKYFKSVKDEGGENTVDFDNELDDDEIKEVVDMEQNSAVIDASKRNIFKTNGKSNIFNSIIGDIDNLAKGIQQELNNITKSINNRD